MRIVIAIDGDLLVPSETRPDIPGQKQEIAHVVGALGALLSANHELVLTHGNAPQVGYVLLRSEAASHIIHRVPLDVCGSDTQGATGYMLQQALLNWLRRNNIPKEVCTLITQVVVDEEHPDVNHPVRGVGPFYDRDKAQTYASTHGWEFVLIPGYGYRRAVPSLMPKSIVEVNTIRDLVSHKRILICAGGGGVPVSFSPSGELHGMEVVVDKAYTSSLLAAQIQAEGMVFVSLQERVEEMLHRKLDKRPVLLSLASLDEALAKSNSELSDDLYSKLQASRWFIRKGGKWVTITAPGYVSAQPWESGGILVHEDISTPIMS